LKKKKPLWWSSCCTTDACALADTAGMINPPLDELVLTEEKALIRFFEQTALN
jgi:hypothetical protein